MPKRACRRPRNPSPCAACHRYRKGCTPNCQLKKFFPSEINFSNLFDAVGGHQALIDLLNEQLQGREKTDYERTLQIRAILVEENIWKLNPISGTVGVICALLQRIKFLEQQQPPSTSRMVPLASSTSFNSNDPFNNLNDLTGINSIIYPYSSFLSTYVVGSQEGMNSSMVALGSNTMSLVTSATPVSTSCMGNTNSVTTVGLVGLGGYMNPTMAGPGSSTNQLGLGLIGAATDRWTTSLVSIDSASSMAMVSLGGNTYSTTAVLGRGDANQLRPGLIEPATDTYGSVSTRSFMGNDVAMVRHNRGMSAYLVNDEAGTSTCLVPQQTDDNLLIPAAASHPYRGVEFDNKELTEADKLTQEQAEAMVSSFYIDNEN